MYHFCGDCCHQTSWFHAYWCFTSKPTILEDDNSYPNMELKINCRCNSSNGREYGGYHHINEIGRFFFMFSSEQHGQKHMTILMAPNRITFYLLIHVIRSC